MILVGRLKIDILQDIIFCLSILFCILQRVMQLGFDWDTHEMSILLLAKLAKPLMGTARIVINSLHIKGDVCKTIFFPFFVFLT